MTAALFRRPRLVAGVLALALAVVSSATCLAAALQVPETQHHACCAGMSKDCADTVSVQKDCCAVPSADIARVGGSQSVPVPTVTTVMVAEPMVNDAPLVTAFDSGIPTPSSSPTYLLVSVFRL